MQTDPVNHLSMGQPYCNIGFYSKIDIILQICESYNDFFVQLCVVKKYLNELKFFDLTIFCFVIMINFYAFCHYVLIRGVFKK